MPARVLRNASEKKKVLVCVHVPGVAYVVRAKSEVAVGMLQFAAMWNELTYIDGCEMVMVEKHLNMEQVFNEFTGQIQGYGQT